MKRRVFTTRHFSRWQDKAGLTDQALCKAVAEMEQGLIDADLGGGVVKKRVPLPGRGKSGSTRTLVATNKGNRWFFLFGFEKNVRATISAQELEVLRKTAHDWLSATEHQLGQAVMTSMLKEICHED